MKVKIEYEGDVRRLRAVPKDFQSLHQEIIRTFDFESSATFVVKYKDEDQDLVTIASTPELEDAVELCEERSWNLKLLVTRVLPKNNSEVPEESKNGPCGGTRGPCGGRGGGRRRAKWREAVREFFGDEKVRAELPEALQVLLTNLSEFSPEESLKSTLALYPSIRTSKLVKMARPRLPHLLQKVQPFIPLVLHHAENLKAFVNNLCSQMKEGGDPFSFFPCGGGAAGGESPMGPLGPFAFLAPLFAAGGGEAGGFPFAQMFTGRAGPCGGVPCGPTDTCGGAPCAPTHTPAEDEEDIEEQETLAASEESDGGDEELKTEPPQAEASEAKPTEVVHEGVVCDGCEMTPIVGIRFKCHECPDFDLCASCEARPNREKFRSLGHSVDHMLVKLRKSAEHTRWGPFGPRGRFGRFGRFGHGGFGHRGGHRGFSRFGHPGHHGPWAGRGRGGHAHAHRFRDGKKSLNRGFFKVKITDEVTIREGTHVATGSKLNKVWKVENTGSVAWPRGTRIVHCKGDRFGPFETELPSAVEPGQQIEISVPIEVPSEAGHYAAKYRLKLPEEVQPPRKFGRMFLVRFVAEDQPEEVVRDQPEAPSEPVVQGGAQVPSNEKEVDLQGLFEAIPSDEVDVVKGFFDELLKEQERLKEVRESNKDVEAGSAVSEPAATIPTVVAEAPELVTEVSVPQPPTVSVAESLPAVQVGDSPVVVSPVDSPVPSVAGDVAEAEVEPLVEEVKEHAPPAGADVQPAAPEKYSKQLEILEAMGFPHFDLNLWVLKENDGNVQAAALQLAKLQAAA